MLNKPAGYTCSSADAHAEHLYLELLPERFGRLFSIGRLDRDSEGLLLVTNDGEFAQALAHPSHEVTKRYRVCCRGQVDDAALLRMCRGIRDAGEMLRAERVRRLSSRGDRVELEFVLVEGRKREIRRLCARSGLRVTELRRVAVGSVTLGGLAPGRWRHLREPEIGALRAAAGVTGEKP
jgi:23S rRNA pseudouridine2605 synthase